MKTLSAQFAALLALVCLSLAACQPPGGCDLPPDGCPANLACTMDLPLITLAVQDSAGRPVALDEFRTVRQRGSFLVPMETDSASLQSQRQSGRYIVAGDGLLPQTQKNGEAFDFYGYRNGREVLRRTYFLGHDCCHLRELDSNSATVTISTAN